MTTIVKVEQHVMFTFHVLVPDVPHWAFLDALREHPAVAYAMCRGNGDVYQISLGVHTEEIGRDVLEYTLAEAAATAKRKFRNSIYNRRRAYKRRNARVQA